MFSLICGWVGEERGLQAAGAEIVAWASFIQNTHGNTWETHCFHYLALRLKPLGGISRMSKTIQLQSFPQSEAL